MKLVSSVIRVGTLPSISSFSSWCVFSFFFFLGKVGRVDLFKSKRVVPIGVGVKERETL